MSVGYKLLSERHDMESTFCRAYSCRAAIEKFLADLFLFDAATGLYVASYNPKLTLETDDVQQIIWISGVNSPCNAFNIVRTYRFGELDKSVKEGTSTKRLPSYRAMLQLCNEDTTVRLSLIKEASNTKREYEQRISQLERWYEDNTDAVAFGQFYRENYPKQYRQWHTGQWQQDIAYRDSLRRAHSLDRLRRLYQSDD